MGADLVVQRYENAVGFLTAPVEEAAGADLAAQARRVSLLCGNIPPTGSAQENWDRQTQAISGTVLPRLDHEVYHAAVASVTAKASVWPSILDLDLDLPLEKQKREIIDLTDSEQSVESEEMPSTPKPQRTYARAVSDDVDCECGSRVRQAFHILTKLFHRGNFSRLNPSPQPISPSSNSSSPRVSDELRSESSHTSHTRSSSLPPSVSLHKDEQGFYYSVYDGSRDDSAYLPPFLLNASARARKPHSRTREIIDRLRCSTSSRGRQLTRSEGEQEELSSSRPAQLTRETVRKLFQRGSDGWIKMSSGENGEMPAPSNDFAPRQDVLINPAEDADTEDAFIPYGSTIRPAALAIKKKGSGNVKQKHNRRSSHLDGWIDPSRPVPTRPPPTAPASVGTFTFPPPPVYPVMYPSGGYGMMQPYPAAPPLAPYSGPYPAYPGAAPYPMVSLQPPFVSIPPRIYASTGYSNGAGLGPQGTRHTSW